MKQPDLEDSILAAIVARKRRDVALRSASRSRKSIERGLLPSDRDFRAALATPGLSLIAEIKQRSPSRGILRPDFDPAAIARIYEGRAAAISVLCDAPYFGGDLAHLAIVRAEASAPLIAKDFVIDPYQIVEARAAGADAVLLLANVLTPGEIESAIGLARDLRMAALVEVHSGHELETILRETSAEIIGVNSRDLKTMRIHDEIVFGLLPTVRAADKIAVAESGVAERAQVERIATIADAVLIGSAFMAAPDIAQKLTSLGW